MSGETECWVHAVQTAVQGIIPATFVGQIEVNCFKGAVANITVKQSFKEEKTK